MYISYDVYVIHVVTFWKYNLLMVRRIDNRFDLANGQYDRCVL